MTQATDYKFVVPGAQVTVKHHDVAVLVTFVQARCTAGVVPMTYAQELAFLASHT